MADGALYITILLGVCAGLIFQLLLIGLGIRGKLGRIERLLAGKNETVSAPTQPLIPDAAPGGKFEKFLEEDPSRKTMSKKEQAIAYRKWRSEQGMNWSNS